MEFIVILLLPWEKLIHSQRPSKFKVMWLGILLKGERQTLLLVRLDFHVLLCNVAWAGLELSLPALVSQVLESQACTSTPQH